MSLSPSTFLDVQLQQRGLKDTQFFLQLNQCKWLPESTQLPSVSLPLERVLCLRIIETGIVPEIFFFPLFHSWDFFASSSEPTGLDFQADDGRREPSTLGGELEGAVEKLSFKTC